MLGKEFVFYRLLGGLKRAGTVERGVIVRGWK